MELIRCDGYVVIPRIVRDYASPHFEIFEHEILSCSTMEEYEAFIAKQMVKFHAILKEFIGKDVQPPEKCVYGVYATMMPTNGVLSFEMPHFDILNEMTLTLRFGTGTDERNAMRDYQRQDGLRNYSANLEDIFGNSLTQIRLLENVTDQVAFASESQLIQCYGRENCVNLFTPTTNVIDVEEQNRNHFAFYMLHAAVAKQYYVLFCYYVHHSID